jgi:hypothetical protein
MALTLDLHQQIYRGKALAIFLVGYNATHEAGTKKERMPRNWLFHITGN